MHPDSFRVHGRGPLQRALAQTSTRVVRRARGSAPQAAGLHVEASAAPFKTALHGPESAGPPSTPATRQALCPFVQRHVAAGAFACHQEDEGQ